MSTCGLEMLRCGLQWRRRWRCWREALDVAIDGQVEEYEIKKEIQNEREALISQLHGLLLASLSADEEDPSRAGSALAAALLAISGALKLGRGLVPEKHIGRSGPAETFGENLIIFSSLFLDYFSFFIFHFLIFIYLCREEDSDVSK